MVELTVAQKLNTYPGVVQAELIVIAQTFNVNLREIFKIYDERLNDWFKSTEEALQLTASYFGRKGFKPGYIADLLLDKYDIITPSDGLPCIFNKISYEVDFNLFTLEKSIRDVIGVSTTIGNVKEVIAALVSKTYDNTINIYNPKNKYICCRDCLINLDTGEYKNHTPSLKVFGYIDIDYLPKVDTEPWIKYVEGLIRKEDITRFNQAISDVLNPNYVSKKALWFYGKFSSGRSTFMQNIESIIGKSNCSALSLRQIGIDRMRGSLFGKQLNFKVEDNLHFREKQVTALKEVTGDDEIELPVLYHQKNIKFTSYAKQWFGGNSTPTATESVREFYERWNPFIFPHEFARTVKYKLWLDDSAKTAALQTMIATNIELRRNNYKCADEPEWTEVRNFFIKYNAKVTDEQEGFNQWRHKKLEVVEKDTYVFAYEIFKDCAEWCENRLLQGYPLSEADAGKFMSNLQDEYSFIIKSPLSSYYSKQRKAYYGLKLKLDGTEKWKKKYGEYR